MTAKTNLVPFQFPAFKPLPKEQKQTGLFQQAQTLSFQHSPPATDSFIARLGMPPSPSARPVGKQNQQPVGQSGETAATTTLPASAVVRDSSSDQGDSSSDQHKKQTSKDDTLTDLLSDL